MFEKINYAITVIGDNLEISTQIIKKTFYIEMAMAECWMVEDGEKASLDRVIFAEKISNTEITEQVKKVIIWKMMGLVLSLFDVIDKPDFSNVPEISRPIMNPTLVCAANHFYQGLSIKRDTRDMEANMFKEIYNAKYLMPLDSSKMNMEKTDAENGECVVKEKSIMQFPLIMNSENKSFHPFFTDWNEFRRFDKEQKFSGNIVTFEDIKYFIDKADGISINPYGVNITLTKDILHVIESVAKGSPQNMVIKEQVVEKDTKVMLGEPTEYPQKMIDEVCKYLKTNKNVNAAYLRLMVKDNQKSYLMIVDFSGDINEVFSGIANAGVPYSNGKYFDFIPLSSDFAKGAVENVEPFYKKKKFGFFG